ncbi:PAS domain-containing sensor histidine kinase [Paraliomyxa miuraensis]|uniref:PAS domain-containing sensor histidine kinase n=1 Tax=Paraliomyxa miuraensis TaxID=376150 RepID=UPI0022561302|nr:PAS domain S-box protein [Paraliomyxa miuraensis]MCX4246935.1 PAS domain S-box protein [Paraliomyxa miuraensis]
MDGGPLEGDEETRRTALPELFLELSTDGTILAVRGRRVEDFGIDPKGSVGRRISDVLSPSQADAIRDCVERSIRTDSVVFTEHVSSAGGRRRFWQARTIPLGPDRAMRMVIDMSEQLRWHQALERSEARFRQLVEQAVDGIFVCDEDGRLVDVNRQACDSLGYSREEVLEMNLVELCQGLEIEMLWEMLDRLDPGQSETHAAAHVREDGSTFPVELHLGPFWDSAGEPRILALARDVTDRQRLEKAALEAAEQEARRIGRDLHDGLGQHLTGMAFLAKGLERSLNERGLPEAAEAREIVKLVKEAVGHSRALAHGLAPVGVHGTELTPALENLAERTREVFGIDCEFQGEQVARVPDDATATAFYRIAQEATNNALKHGKASRITIRLETDADESLRLTIEDDGIGLRSSRPTGDGLGLRLMKLRAETVGAKIVIEDVDDDGGTRVECVLPKGAVGRDRFANLRSTSSPLPAARSVGDEPENEDPSA